MHKKIALLALTIVWLAVTGAVLAQAPADPNLVYVPVVVTGAKNALIPGLKKENFKLLEDGIEQTVTSFSAEDQAADIDIVLAMSALQRGRADSVSQKIRDAVENFRQQGNAKTKYTLEELPFGPNGIFDGIGRHLARLTEASTNPRKALVVITDDFESSGGDPVHQLQEVAKKLPVPIYIIFAAGTSAPTDDIQAVGRGQAIHLTAGAGFEDLASMTGGKLYQAEADTQLRSNLDVLSKELKSEYLLGFKSTNDARDDKWRKLEVKMVSAPAPLKEKDLKVKVRARYFVAKPKK